MKKNRLISIVLLMSFLMVPNSYAIVLDQDNELKFEEKKGQDIADIQNYIWQEQGDEPQIVNSAWCPLTVNLDGKVVYSNSFYQPDNRDDLTLPDDLWDVLKANGYTQSTITINGVEYNKDTPFFKPEQFDKHQGSSFSLYNNIDIIKNTTIQNVNGAKSCTVVGICCKGANGIFNTNTNPRTLKYYPDPDSTSTYIQLNSALTNQYKGKTAEITLSVDVFGNINCYHRCTTCGRLYHNIERYYNNIYPNSYYLDLKNGSYYPFYNTYGTCKYRASCKTDNADVCQLYLYVNGAKVRRTSDNKLMGDGNESLSPSSGTIRVKVPDDGKIYFDCANDRGASNLSLGGWGTRMNFVISKVTLKAS